MKNIQFHAKRGKINKDCWYLGFTTPWISVYLSRYRMPLRFDWTRFKRGLTVDFFKHYGLTVRLGE